ncbi:hypothetical protein VQL36_11360 [Chengkuizengella sp. SCS-71B]|uniref:hypothetical protein n=1 Tax=Chengkuizengella sp. SCS-71B TaxID=3115290 RepID=UPI0032C23BBE
MDFVTLTMVQGKMNITYGPISPLRVNSLDEVKGLINSMDKPEALSKAPLESGNQDQIIRWFIDLQNWEMEVIEKSTPKFYTEKDAYDVIKDTINQYYGDNMNQMIKYTSYLGEDPSSEYYKPCECDSFIVTNYLEDMYDLLTQLTYLEKLLNII